MSNSGLLSRDVWNILGLPFDNINLNESAKYVGNAVESRDPCFISTPNLNFVVATQSDLSFYQSVIESDLSLADGMPLIWVAKLLNIPITERVAGSSLFDKLAQGENTKNKIKVFFFGGQEGIAETAHQQLNQNANGMECCGHYDPGFVTVDEMSSPTIIDTINATQPDFIVVALGAKKGQQWIQQNRSHLTAPIISHLGAVINFVAGYVERAPKFWQNTGLEWLWRIKQEPALWRRYLFDGIAFLKLISFNILPLAIMDGWLKRTNAYHQKFELRIAHKTGTLVALSGSLKYSELFQVKELLENELAKNKDGDVEIDCSELSYIDGAFIASLLLFQHYLNEQQRQLYLSNVPDTINRLLALNNVIKRFQYN